MPFPASSSPLLGPLTAAPEDALLVVDAMGEHRAAELGRDVRCAAGALCGPNKSLASRRVGLLVEPGADWLKCLLAVLTAGGIALPLALSYPDAELSWLLSDAAADTLVASPSQSDRALPAAVRTVTPAELFAARDGTGWEPPPGEIGGEPAMLLYTSGTTGKPKGAVLTHANLAIQAHSLRRAWQLTPADVLLHALPLHHAHGINISLLPALVAGATTHMMERFDAHAVWDRLDRATVFMGVPTMYVRLLAALEGAASEERQRWSRAARGLRLAVSGSAALPARVARQWSQLAGAIPLERFGMTEIGVGMSNPIDEHERRVGRVGRPLDVIDLRLVDDAGAVVACGPGEVQLRGEGVFESYWRRPQASREAFVDGWFKTGDLAERDEDGVLRILGRTSVDIIKSGGYKLSALEIEEALREHPAVADLAVVGLPDEIWGQRVAAAVVPRPGRADECVTAILRPWAKQQLAPYKVPREFVVLETLPRNPLGKVLKPQLAKLLASRRG